ncbi:hypothetical protein WM40_24590 [Robbsia andropogonis]|uniref:DUF4148 domain-containing protein n=1 Tax=Robbsia andropogonis TaxID=28092 RepID=A0A0F5JTP0_9BURK|nr:hypothetical protein WM40_24590 [Robbsia andropogonis]
MGALACAATLVGTVSVASAADAQGTNGPTNASPYTSPSAVNSAPGTHASGTHAERKAARKASRKVHREQKNAELKSLEKNGYNPSQNDPKYPASLQNAERKAAGQPTQPAGQ